MELGDRLDPAHRERLARVALDVTHEGFLHNRLQHLHAGGFPSRTRTETTVVVKWATRRVPFPEIRRIYDWDVQSVRSIAGGRLGSLLNGWAQPEDFPGRAEIDPGLARRMPKPTLDCPADPDLVPESATRPIVDLAMLGPVFGQLCEGVDVPPAPIRRNLETEPRLIGPDGVIRWNMASLLSEADMAALATEFANRTYTLLLGVAEGRIAGEPPRADGWPSLEFRPGLLPV